MKVIWIIIIVVLLTFSACVEIKMLRHPDFNFMATNPNSVRIYNQMLPTKQFYIIGVITIDATWGWSQSQTENEIRLDASTIGGDGVIITNEKIDIYAFNLGTKTTGSAQLWGNMISYHQTTTPNMMYIPVHMMYGYIIRWKDHK